MGRVFYCVISLPAAYSLGIGRLRLLRISICYDDPDKADGRNTYRGRTMTHAVLA